MLLLLLLVIKVMEFVSLKVVIRHMMVPNDSDNGGDNGYIIKDSSSFTANLK